MPVFLLLYNIFTRSYYLAIRIAAAWNPKARLWIEGRRNLFSKIEAEYRADEGRSTVWMHCASLGEFEQGRFLLERIKSAFPGVRIVISFFSPSGYEVMKDYSGADHVFYLPMFNKRSAARFIDIIQPSLVLWIKYDYWRHYLTELKRRNIPLLLISAIFQKHQPFFKWYGSLYKKMLRCFTWLFVQTPESATRLKAIGFSDNVTVNGDTRFDRVIDIAENFREAPGIREFCGDQKVIVAGSTWLEDEEELAHYVRSNPHIRFIIAPHEIEETRLQEIEKLLKHTARYSQWMANRQSAAHVLIIDNMGMLSRLYYYADIAYVGGGFGDEGVHNMLEAAVYGKPMVIGPVFNQFREAIDLLEEGAAITISNALELENALNELLGKKEDYRERSEAAKHYVYAKKGATLNILNYIQENRLLIN